MTAGFYHCSVKPVGRANGRSIVAAAAYRHGERLADVRTGEVFDYRARGGVLDSFILAPDAAPDWAHERQQLWNEAERAEPRANGRLATELELALPCELDAAQRRDLVRDFLVPIIARHGVAADVAIHAPGQDGDHRNHHAHVLLTHRELGPDGFGEIANRRTVAKKVKGQEKQVEIAGIAATPSDIKAIRQAWERDVNRAYERAGLDIRVDHRSHKDRAIEQEPSKHLGPSASGIERRGAFSDRGDVNREITLRNAERERLAELAAQAAAIKAELASITHWDRDAADREWQEKLEAAAVAPKPAQAAAQEARQGREHGRGEHDGPAAARGDYAPLQPPPAASQPERRGTAAKIREAWQESYDPNPAADAAALHAAMLARGIALARVGAEEAYASERRAALAKAAGNFAPAMPDGEIVAVNGRGQVYRFTERITGDDKLVIAGRLAGLDSDLLPNLADAQEAAREAGRAAWQQRQDEERDAARRDAPVAGAAADIRTAWQTSRTASELEDALAAHGVSLAQVSPEEAYASERRAALAKEAGNFAPVWRAGEIVAVDGRGAAYRLDARTTGDERGEIEGRLAGIDRAALMDVAATQEAMRAASLDSWKAERQAEREAARPATALEGRIIECAEQARLFGAHVQKDEQGAVLLGADALAYRMRDPDERTGEAAIIYGPEAFAARLHDVGIAIVRATAADIPALDALRQGEDMARLAATTNGEARQQHHYAALIEGELAAVTRGGDVHRINADKLSGVDIPADLPSVTDARKSFEIDRAQTEALYDLARADIAAARDAFEDGQELRQTLRAAEHAVHRTFAVPAAAIDTALDATSGLLGGAARIVSAVGDFLGGLFGGPKITHGQAKEILQARGSEETLYAQSYAATVQAKEAEFDERMHAQKTADQQQDLSFAARYGTPPTREANLGRDRDDHERERER